MRRLTGNSLRGIFLWLILLIGFLFATEASAQHVVVDGKLWMQSTPEIRKAFLIGAANGIALEKAYAEKTGTPAPQAGAIAAKAVDGLTLDQISGRITQWYEANPGRRDMSVMAVLWIDMVRPTIK